MANYEGVAEEPVWTKTVFNSEMEVVADDRGYDAVEGVESFYWIESDEREDFLVVPDFVAMEELVIEFRENPDLTFEKVVEERGSGYSIEEHSPY